jgi:hypothetical protein
VGERERVRAADLMSPAQDVTCIRTEHFTPVEKMEVSFQLEKNTWRRPMRDYGHVSMCIILEEIWQWHRAHG